MQEKLVEKIDAYKKQRDALVQKYQEGQTVLSNLLQSIDKVDGAIIALTDMQTETPENTQPKTLKKK